MPHRSRYTPWLSLLLACGHSDTFVNSVPVVAPPAAGPDVRLTFNADQDYWPTWTEDGQGILYAFVDPVDLRHRCVGLLPAAGGPRTWQMCRNMVAYTDSVSSFGGYALGNDGRLLYTEATSKFIAGVPAPGQAAPQFVKLWLADSAKPFVRTALLSLPVSVDNSLIAWISDIAWTGPASFVALGQGIAIVRHCFGVAIPPDPACDLSDTVFSTGSTASDAGAVVRGTIANGHATLNVVTGTAGATGYSLAENGASVVFSRREETVLYKVPIGGGTATAVGDAAAPLRPGYQVLGIACRGTTCLAATDSVTLTRLEPSKIFPILRSGTRELRTISLTTGISATVSAFPVIISSLAISPVSGDVVLQVGGMWGHLQTFEGAVPSDLHLLAGIVH